jgi:NAD(P)-dependent dehydrogenase (short-subunit alcohol dehydrogenase family)
MKINGSVALVTGANRGLGRAFAEALLERGAAKVYAGVRNPASVPSESRLTPIQLDITNPADVAAAAAALSDVDLVINNAGISTGGSLLSAPDLTGFRADFETNVVGTVEVARAFAPILKANGGGALVNMLSALSFVTYPHIGSYSASKSAAWSVTNALRLELNAQGTLVVGVHAGYIDTDMTARIDDPKSDPADIAREVMDAIERGDEEVLADETSRYVKAGLSGSLRGLYPSLV